jgi:hypothetical protein
MAISESKRQKAKMVQVAGLQVADLQVASE